jgi:hypothetical protein
MECLVMGVGVNGVHPSRSPVRHLSFEVGPLFLYTTDISVNHNTCKNPRLFCCKLICIETEDLLGQPEKDCCCTEC